MTDMPLLIAHRGASTHFRENSPSAWAGAIAAGADVIEADTRITADHRIVISHDADLSRVAGHKVVVSESTFADLQGITADGALAAPPLSMLFSEVPATQPILFDVKDESPEALALLVEAALATGRNNLTFGLHRIESLDRVRALGWSGAVLGLLVDMAEQEAFAAHGGTILRMWESYALAHRERLAAHVATGTPVWITVGDKAAGRAVGEHAGETLLRLAMLGASGFLVNDPASCRDALRAGLSE
ncbi:glycerophosphodiester phosphodiesterase [Halovulum sp. GXIMD14794]